MMRWAIGEPAPCLTPLHFLSHSHDRTDRFGFSPKISLIKNFSIPTRGRSYQEWISSYFNNSICDLPSQGDCVHRFKTGKFLERGELCPKRIAFGYSREGLLCKTFYPIKGIIDINLDHGFLNL